MSPSHIEEIGKAKRLRHSAAEYHRRGIGDVRAGAPYVFRNDERSMERYPGLFIRRRRRTDRSKASGEVMSISVALMPAVAAAESEPSFQNHQNLGDNAGAFPAEG